MPKIDISQVPVKTGSAYPGKLSKQMDGRAQQALGRFAGLTQFGANLVTLEPGALSSLRHWHEQQDEFLMVTSGTLTLIEDGGETVLNPGDCAAFLAGVANGHHLVNKSGQPGAFLVIGTHTPQEVGYYSDTDMMVRVDASGFHFTTRNGDPVADISE